MSEPLLFELTSEGREGYSLPASDLPEIHAESLIPKSYLSTASLAINGPPPPPVRTA